MPGGVYEFLFVAKDGGSANKTQERKALLGSEKQPLAFPDSTLLIRYRSLC